MWAQSVRRCAASHLKKIQGESNSELKILMADGMKKQHPEARLLGDSGLVSDPPMLKMTPTAARNVNLPDPRLCSGFSYTIINTSGGAFSLTLTSTISGAIVGNATVAPVLVLDPPI